MGRAKIATVVGIGGKYCVGKGVVTRLFVDRGGYRKIDIDTVGHEALEEHKTEIAAHFGKEIIGQDGSVDRGRLGSIVFRDRNALRQLEKIVHPWMFHRVAEYLKTSQSSRIVIDAALLCYLKLDTLCDKVIWVRASLLRRLARARRRDQISFFAAARIIRAQKRLKLGSITTDTYIINNNASKKRLVERCVRQFGGLWH